MNDNGHFPPKGWTVANGYIEEVTTVFGYMQRHAEMVGRCQTQECRRTYYVEFPRLIKQGMADVQMSLVIKTFRCNHLSGCSMQFAPRGGQVITLRQLVGRPNVAARIFCDRCREPRVTSVAALARQLGAAGRGDASTSIRDIGRLIKGNCGKCHGDRWTVEFLWHDPNGKPPSWRTALDERLAEAQRRRDLDRGLVA